jgi:hypothetical protein
MFSGTRPYDSLAQARTHTEMGEYKITDVEAMLGHDGILSQKPDDDLITG